MRFVNRDVVEEKLKEQIGSKRRGWLTIEFEDNYESNHCTGETTFSELVKIFDMFLNHYNVKDILFFPENDGSGWTEYSGDEQFAGVGFDSPEEALNFLQQNVMYGADNYYITNKQMDWVLAICHEEDLHICGSKEFVEEFITNYIEDS